MFKRVIFLGSVLGLGICFNGSYCSEASLAFPNDSLQEESGKCLLCGMPLSEDSLGFSGDSFGGESGRCLLCGMPLVDITVDTTHAQDNLDGPKPKIGKQSRNSASVNSQVTIPQPSGTSRVLLRNYALRQYLNEIEGMKTGPFTCTFCNTLSVYRHKSSLMSHVRTQHDKRMLKICDLCGYECMGRANLRNHRGRRKCRKRQKLKEGGK